MRFPKGEKALPGFLAFPNPEIIILGFTVQPMAQCVGVLLSIKDPSVPAGIGIVPLFYLIAVMSCLFYLCITIAFRYRPLLEDSQKDVKKDVLVHFYHFISGKDKHFIRQVSKTEIQWEKDVKKMLEPERTQLYLRYGVSIQGIRHLLFQRAPEQVGLLKGEHTSSWDDERASSGAIQAEFSNKVVPITAGPLSADTDKEDEEDAVLNAQMKREVLRDELVKTEVHERLGPIFGDVDKRSIFTSTFFLVAMVNKLIAGLLTGIQQGSDASEGSRGAIGLNIGLLLCQGSFTIWMCFIRPQRAFTAVLLQCVTEWLQTGTCLCES
jgi:hypothetical protein